MTASDSTSTAGGDSHLSPLLPSTSTTRPPPPAASVSGAVFNLSTSIVGAGMMSIPATMKVLGVLPAIALILFVALLCDYSVEFLLRYTAPTPSAAGMSYAGVMRESFGKAGSTLLQVFVILTNVGALVMYLIIIGDVLSGNRSKDGTLHWGILQEWAGGEQWWNGREVALLFTLIFVLLPLLFLRRVDSLRFSSALAVLLAVAFLGICSGIAIYALSNGVAYQTRLLPDFNHLSSYFELFTAVPVVVLAFTFHFNVHPIRAELSTSSDMTLAVRLSLILCSAIYAAVGFFGYLLFGEGIMDDILANFDNNSSSLSPLLNDSVRLSYALHLVLVFPLLFFSLRINVDGLLFPKSIPLAYHQGRFVIVTIVLAALAYIAAIVIPDIWTLFQLFGSTTAVSLSLIFPAAIVLRDVHEFSGVKDKILASGMIILAVATSCIAIASNVMSLYSS